MALIMFMHLFVGVLLIALAIPLILGKIPPNGLYGFRIRKTMEHPEIWYPVNKYSGKWLVIAGLSIILATLAFRWIPGITLDVYSLAALAVWVVVFTIGIVATVRYMNSL